MAVSVPDNDTYSLLDVYNAVKDHASSTSGNLDSCFEKSIPGYFDPSYNNNSYAVPNSLKRFRNYGPRNPAAEGLFEIDFPSAGVKRRGALIYVSTNGLYLYIYHVIIIGANTIHGVSKFNLGTPFDPSTAVHDMTTVIQSNNQGAYNSLRFSEDGTKMYMSYAFNTPTTTPSKIRTWILPSPWNFAASSDNYYDTTFHRGVYEGAHSLLRRFTFSDNGRYLFIYLKRSAYVPVLLYYYLNTPFSIPTGTLNLTGYAIFNRQEVPDTVQFEVFNSLSSIELTDAYNQLLQTYNINLNQGSVNTPPFTVPNDKVLRYQLNNIMYYADLYTRKPDGAYSFILEDNAGSSFLFPRVYLKFN